MAYGAHGPSRKVRAKVSQRTIAGPQEAGTKVMSLSAMSDGVTMYMSSGGVSSNIRQIFSETRMSAKYNLAAAKPRRSTSPDRMSAAASAGKKSDERLNANLRERPGLACQFSDRSRQRKLLRTR